MMTIIDPPKIDREKLCREAEARQAARAAARQALALLAAGECLGTPVREGDRLVFPVLRADAPGAPDAASLHALTAAWLDADDG